MITSERWKTAKQHGPCFRCLIRNGSESTPIEKDDKIVEALKEVQVGLMKTENHSRTLLKTAKTWLVEVRVMCLLEPRSQRSFLKKSIRAEE
ncbi:hypothetical protein T03_15203 [Trichinella britovi]|uniref:Uncharacterized protein n=1 Tax=Trichinella britovi TaxID=45882 RepID=A0A0V1CDS7_TRIBR|nr:hypothetical protein T03_15203 [Trichinella britovi]